ncbi:ABC transporter substrate-binding protein [Kineococcus radiotolerans]|uniref:Thiamine pyrimidine synthase n=1 Tax=Kineococcus radiotolerans (strain ATCC BAA-149 / DSM 14245 / SRS30216) TaxID=266940 RepID=A6W7K1_KINRD|nr:ABC transporter substrate-binding protein [Kineococcus radiotolerans]ABS02790.1 NMT1/THI5 like domain protein [Kineococcus radiotolerans SRS30216 = ATCC BAA-149]
MNETRRPRLTADRRTFLRGSGLGLLGAASLAACGNDDAGSSTSSSSGASDGFGEISIQLSWIKNIEFAGEYMADSRGYFSDAGFSKVNLLAGGSSGTAAEAMVLSRKAHVGLSSPTLTAPAIVNEDAPLKIIGSTFQKNPFCLVSVQEKTPVATLADLAGKRLGIQTGGNETIFDGFCRANGIDASSFTIVPVQYDPSVVETGEVDAFMAYLTNEPILLAGRGLTPVTLGFADNGLPVVSETFTVLSSLIESDRDMLKAFLAAEVRGWNDAVADPAASAALAVDTYGKDQGLDLEEQTAEAEAQNTLVVSEDTRTHGLFTMTGELIEENIRALSLMGTEITAEELFDLSLLEEVYQENPDLITG